MTNLSWAIYAADLCQSASVCGELVFIGAGVAGLIAALIASVDDPFGFNARRGWEAGKRFFKAAILVAIVTVPIPSKETVYAIIVSEYGEQLLHTQTANKAEKALDVWLDKQAENKHD